MIWIDTSVSFWDSIALRPNVSSPYHIDDNFSPWKQKFVQSALSQVLMHLYMNVSLMSF